MKEIVCISGKGGTGKTSLAASFAYLAGKTAVIADCDVDAADMHLLTEPDFNESGDFYSGELAVINQELCIQCEKCLNVCRFDAIERKNATLVINEVECEGCGYCKRVCPSDAIININRNVGQWFVSTIKTSAKMVHARLEIGADNSGKLVTHVKNTAKEIALENNSEYVIVDGSPGVGCPVISSLSGANYVVLITEPTISGLHDLKRVYELVRKFNIKAGCVINKFGLNEDISAQILKFISENTIDLLGNIPYMTEFTQALSEGKTIIEYDSAKLKSRVESVWNTIKQNIK